MRMRAKAATCAALIAAAGTTAVAIGSGGDKFRTDLSGFQESPVVITDGEGTFNARLNPAGDAINFELSYGGLEGGEVRQAHIHVGQRTSTAASSSGSATAPRIRAPATPRHARSRRGP